MFRMWSPVFGTGTNRIWALVYWAFLLLILPRGAQGQTTDLCHTANSPGLSGFTLSKIQACVGEAITITNGSPTYKNVTYFLAYDGKSRPPAGSTLPDGTLSTTAKYSAPGTYTILQEGSGFNNTGFYSCQTVEIVENAAVAFSPTGCGRTVNLNAKLDAYTSRYDRIRIDWGDGTIETRTRADVQVGSISHSYAGQLTYIPIKVQGLYDNGGCPGTESTRYTQGLSTGGGKPAITALTTNSDGTITIRYEGTTDVVALQEGDGGFNTWKPTSITATNGSLTFKKSIPQLSQCFKLVTASACAGVTSQESQPECDILLSGVAGSQQNNLGWSASFNPNQVFTQYLLTRNGTGVFSSADKTTASYVDKTNIQCGVQYCYTLTATLQGQASVPVVITSAPACVTGINPTSSTTSQKPAVTALKTNADGTITINYQSTDPIELQQKDASGTYKPVSVSGANGTFTIPADPKQVQCFKVVTKSSCSTAQESEEVCSLILTAKAISKENDLSWQPYAGTAPSFTRYRVYRDNVPMASINTQTTTSYSDKSNIQCNTQYCYYLETTVRGQTETVITSASVCVTGIDTTAPPALQNLFVTIESGAVRVQGTAPSTSSTGQFTAVVSRADNSNGPFQPVGTVENSLLYIDNTANTNQQSYCYRMTYKTACGAASLPSPVVCSVWLTAKTATGIDWSAASPFAPGPVANYILETLDTQDNTTMFLDLGANTHYDPDLNDPNAQRYRYRIVAYDANGTPSYSNYYEFRQEAKLYVQSAFTPNGDGHNDTFLVKGLFVDQFSLTMYNRWGEAVFHTTDPTMPWDGTLNGQPVPAGEYAYHLDIVDMTGQRVVKAGPVLLIRDKP